MSRNKKDSGAMAPGRIDAILATEETLIPSSGFRASVMERIRAEAAIPAPIPFPWMRAVPGIVLLMGVFIWGAFELVQLVLPAASVISLTPPHLSATLVQPLEQVCWVALALGASLLSWRLSSSLAGRSGLL